MKVEIKAETAPVIEAAVRSGQYSSAGAFVDDAIREKVAIDQAADAHYVKLAQEALAAGGFEERGPDWREKIKALASTRRSA